jgi:hypothetical protein
MFKALLYYPNVEEYLNIHNRDEKYNTNFSEIYCALNLHQLCAAFWHVTHGCHIMICFNQQLLIAPAIPHVRFT